MSRTTWGEYWSYCFENGIWRIKDGKVSSNAYSPPLKSLVGMDELEFKKKIGVAAKNQVKNHMLKP